MKSYLLVLLAVCLYVFPLHAQDGGAYSASRVIFDERLQSALSEGWMDDDEANHLREVYEAYLHKPLSVNESNLDDLKDLPFLSEYKALKLLQYRTEHRGIIEDVSQLKEIADWDDDLCILLAPLLDFSRPRQRQIAFNLLDWLSEGKSRATLLSSYTHSPDKSNRYLGSPEALSLLYQWHNRKDISLALAVQKDAYEPWQYHKYTGFDSYHGHLAFKRIGPLKQLIIGQYRVSWGEGLIINQRSSFYQPMDYALQVREGFSPIRGTSEQRFSQGLALELSLTKHLSVSALSSWRRIDGAVSSETLEASAISENSLHREEQSLSRKWQVPLNHYGLQCALTYKRFRLSVQSLYTDFGKYYVAHPPRSGASLQLRNLNRFIVSSLSAKFDSPNHGLQVASELACTIQGAAAFSLRSLIHIKQSELMFNTYVLSPNYWSFFAHGPAHMSAINDVVGGHMGVSILLRQFHLSADAELFQRGLGQESQQRYMGYYLNGTLAYSFNRNTQVSLRLSERSNQRERINRIKATFIKQTDKLHSSFSVQSAYDRSKSLEDVSLAANITLRYDCNQDWHVFASSTYYKTPYWSERLYLMPVQLSQEYSSALLYGNGFLCSLGTNYAWGKHIKLGFRASHCFSRNIHERNTFVALQLTYH